MNYQMLAKLFNSLEFKKVAGGNLEIFHKISDEFPELSSAINITDFYDKAYQILVKNYRNEYVVKNEITNKILLGKHSMKTTSMMSEIRTGNNIADCLVINSYSTCYEIKTEFDSLVRFYEQLTSYRKAYDQTYIVTHESHMEHVLSLHKESPTFGVIELTKRNQLKKIISAPISKEFDFDITFDTLRKSEYMYIAEQVFGNIPKMPNTQLYGYCKEAYQTLSKKNANAIFKDSLKKFRYNDHNFINALPKSLKNIGVSYQLTRNEKNSLLCLCE